MKKLFYIMPCALDALNDDRPTYTPMTNHKTELHTVPVVLLDDALAENKRLLDALLSITYESGGKFYVGVHGDSDVTEDIGDAITKARSLCFRY